MLKAIYLSVFKPCSLVYNHREYSWVMRFGWILIIARWLYYSIIFQFRDYYGRWAPFVSPPFDIETLAFIQRALSLPFGIVLMLLLSLALGAYLRIIKKRVSVFILLNILGTTFFLPFILVQPIDLVMIAFVGWKLSNDP